MKAHAKAREILEEHREQHKLIAEKLLEHETLDAKAIKSLFEEGKMPAGSEDSEFPSEKASSFEEAKRALEAKDAEKQAEEKQDVEEAKDYFANIRQESEVDEISAEESEDKSEE